ncbi:methylated-DNA--[protein]-cysteine S-methyltransferase [Ideonella sp.]|uniref:methylated-DNA--[protein]-cysteine S-methyltransferase n=1 Tax=Ideonella sp. TaxID=1929293 RepID=UPI003BB6864D
MTPLARRPWIAQTTLATPLGALLIAATEHGLGGCWFEGQAHHPGHLDAPEAPDQPCLLQTRHELDSYWRDPVRAQFTMALDPGGTVFQNAVWQLLRGIAAGHSSSYGALAAQLGKPDSARAVGGAVGRNPLSIIVPCHRVLGASGRLTGYAGGLQRKLALLQQEGLPAMAPALWP